MTTKTITLTIPELCARLGIDERGTVSIGKMLQSNGEMWYCVDLHHPKGMKTILSINDKFPTDECETCGKEEKHHGLYCSLSDTFNFNKFKPLLRKVVGIKLTERCECGHGEEWHNNPQLRHSERKICSHNDGTDFDCECKQYKPARMVEITYKED